MTGRLAGAPLERALVELGETLDYPPATQLAARIRGRLEAERVSRLRGALRPLPSLRRSLGLAAAVLLAVTGAATALRFAIRGVEIRERPAPPRTSVPTPETPPPSPTLEVAALGERVSISEAPSRVAFDVLVPASLGIPDEVYVGEEPSGGRMTMLYRPRRGLPASRLTGVGALLTEFRARINEPFALKELEPARTRVERVSVGGEPGYWIEGEPHTVVYVDEAGRPFPDTVRLAGNTLLWQREEVTLRLEAGVTKAEALRIARSTR